MKNIGLTVIAILFTVLLYAQKESEVAKKEPVIYTFVEQNPEFPGGEKELTKFFEDNILYPKTSRENNIQGKVLLRWIVGEDGSVSNIEVRRGLDPELDKEAVRVAELLPKFNPGKQQGKVVKVYYNFPVVFNISTFQKRTSSFDTSRVYVFCERNPEFPGGDSGMIRFIHQNMVYPKVEKANNIQGSVITRFVVERDGSVSHIQVTQSVNPALDEEALRLVKAFPKFKPGLQMDKAVRAYYNTSIKFSLN